MLMSINETRGFPQGHAVSVCTHTSNAITQTATLDSAYYSYDLPFRMESPLLRVFPQQQFLIQVLEEDPSK